MLNKNVLITGGAGQVATGLLSILSEKGMLSSFNIHILDMVEPVVKFEGVDYIEGSYIYDLHDIIIDNEINIIIHLVPNSSLPIFNACKNIPWQMYYIDASVYLNSYTCDVNQNYNLLSNFRKFDLIKNKVPNVKGISSTGMNPGIVNYLFEKLIREYGQKDLLAGYVIENDTYVVKNGNPNKMYVTWGGEACPSECVEHPIWFHNHIPIAIEDTRSVDIPFKFKMKGKTYNGMNVIHEECYRLSKKYNIETTFLYSLPDETVEKIKQFPDVYGEEDVEVISPLKHKTTGSETLGVKLVYKDREINCTNTHTGNEHVTGTTYQVSSGVYSALMTIVEQYRHIDKLEWVDGFFDNPVIFETFGKHIESCLNFEIEHLNESDGMLKDRCTNPKLYNPVEVENVIRNNSNYVFEDFYWIEIEEALEEDFDEQDVFEVYVPLAKALKGKGWGTEEQAKDDIFRLAEELIESNLPDKDMPEDFKISYLEEVLLYEGFHKYNVSHFLQNELDYILENYESFDGDIYEFTVMTYERSGYIDGPY